MWTPNFQTNSRRLTVLPIFGKVKKNGNNAKEIQPGEFTDYPSNYLFVHSKFKKLDEIKMNANSLIKVW